MIPSAPASARAAAPSAARMRSLLLSWGLLASIWAPGLLLVELLVLHRIDLTASALWTAALVPACQALALESLAAPLGLGSALARLLRSLRAPRVYLPWSLAAASLGAAALGGGARILSAAAALLAGGAAALFASAARPSGALRTVRGAALTLALLLLLASASRVAPWLERLPAFVAPDWPPDATRRLVLLPWLGAFYATLFRVQRKLADERPTAATWLSAAAGTGALGLVARLLPFRLDVTAPGAEPLAAGTFLVLVTACLVAAGAALPQGQAER